MSVGSRLFFNTCSLLISITLSFSLSLLILICLLTVNWSVESWRSHRIWLTNLKRTQICVAYTLSHIYRGARRVFLTIESHHMKRIWKNEFDSFGLGQCARTLHFWGSRSFSRRNQSNERRVYERNTQTQLTYCG